MEQTVLAFATRFANAGYHVFPLYGDPNKPNKPYGWARNAVGSDISADKVIPASTDANFVSEWPRLIAEGYNSKVVGYGVLGAGIIIVDLDNKGDKSGSKEWRPLRASQGIPEPAMVVKSRSGGYHLYYAKPDKLRSVQIKSVASVTIAGQMYPGVDIRGDGGFVVGPLSEGPEAEWAPGQYKLIKGLETDELSQVPLNFAIALSKSSIGMSESVTIQSIPESTSELEMLKRGEIPPQLSNGNRNNGFFLYLTALRNKGFSQSTARKYAQELIKVTEDAETLSDSVDVEDMLKRLWNVDLNNPYDVARDLIDCGLYRLTNHKSKLVYTILEDNPYIDSRSAHDIQSMKQLLSKFARKVNVGSDDKVKPKLINPADMIDALITPDREVASISYKPGASEVFTLTEADGGKRYLNAWSDPRKHIHQVRTRSKYWEDFKFVVSRIFGPEGSDEYQLGLDFPAWILQKPGIKPVVAPFIMSRNRGVGKSLYFQILGQIFGYSMTGELQARQFKVDEITGRFFNPTGASLLMFDEVQFPAHRNMRQESTQFWKHLKSLVTLETMPVEIKGGDTHQMPNYAGIIMAGNNGNNFPIEEFDRRIWLIDNDPIPLEEGLVDEFFAMTKNMMTREEKRDIINSLLMHLNEHKIKMPLDRIRAPMNEIKREMYLSTLSDIEEWFITYFDNRENLLARTPVLSKSAIIYLITVAERLLNSKWREDPENTFRELKRRGMIHPIRTKGNNYQTRNLRGVPIVKHDGSIEQSGEGRDVLYTTRQHGELNEESNEVILQMLFANLNTVTKWKNNQLRARTNSIAGSL